MNIWAFTIKARERAFELAKTLDPNFTSTNSEDVLKFLQNVDALKLSAAATQLKVSIRSNIT